MIEAPSSTWFTVGPHWHWYIVFYFFLGGLAGGCYFLAVIIDLFGKHADRPLARLGYYLALPLLMLCGPLLILDLNRPLRFWHMLVERNTFEPMFKYWSPMSVGSWGLLGFGLFASLSFLAALAGDERVSSSPLRRLQWPSLTALRPPAPLGYVVAVLGGIMGFFLAGYTGVLLAVTNRPIWADTPLLGMLFVVSAASTAAALLVLLSHRGAHSGTGVASLRTLDDWVIVLELLVIVALLVSLGPVLQAWLNMWGVLLFVTVMVGMVVPLLLSWRARQRGIHTAWTASCVLVGGFLLRMVIVLSSEAI